MAAPALAAAAEVGELTPASSRRRPRLSTRPASWRRYSPRRRDRRVWRRWSPVAEVEHQIGELAPALALSRRAKVEPSVGGSRRSRRRPSVDVSERLRPAICEGFVRWRSAGRSPGRCRVRGTKVEHQVGEPPRRSVRRPRSASYRRRSPRRPRSARWLRGGRLDDQPAIELEREGALAPPSSASGGMLGRDFWRSASQGLDPPEFLGHSRGVGTLDAHRVSGGVRGTC